MNDSLSVTKQSISLITNGDADAARKIKMLLPYGGKLTDDNALALAAYSRLHGLDPFNGECYFLVREKYDDNGVLIKREELGVYPGIRGKRKLAKQQLQSIDPEGSYRIDYLVVGPDAVGLKPPPGEISVVIQAELRDSQSTTRYIADTIKLRDAGIDVETTKAIMGKPPVWTGFGVVKSNELRYIKQNPITLAKKRAESDATNQRFDLPFSDDALADDIAPEIVDTLDGQPTDITVIDEPIERLTTAQALDDLGFVVAPESSPIDIPDNLKSGEDIEVMKPVKKAATPPPPDNFLTSNDAPVKEKVTFCGLHQVEMRQFSKDGKTWYSHKTDGNAWCSGKPKLATQSQ